MKKITLPLLLLVCLLGCLPRVTTRDVTTYVPRGEWPESEYNKLKKNENRESPLTVSGQAFLRTRGGNVIVGAGSKILLNPVTSYSNKFVDVIIKETHGKGCVLDPKDPDRRIFDYIKVTLADAEGRFSFKHVPEGEYHLYTTVTWEIPSLYSKQLSLQGGWVYKRVTVSKESDNDFVLTY